LAGDALDRLWHQNNPWQDFGGLSLSKLAGYDAEL
jgi:hypothetical protein